MKRIKLTQGQFALVDDCDYEWLSMWKWHASWRKGVQNFYAERIWKDTNNKRHTIFMHREILELKLYDKRQVDHINHNTLDNRRNNLRVVTCRQNHFNVKNVRGYYWQKAIRKYHARIQINGKGIHLGYFKTKKEARQAYLKAKKKYHAY